jgi:NADPH-dependent glutamate synthase beta subunit-like oxidoreductase
MIRTLDRQKCVGCGVCQRICPLDVFRLEVDQPVISPCSAACPIEIDIRSLQYQLHMGAVSDAARMMFRNNPLAAVTGRVCPRFCESECTRGGVDAAVNISAIEQYLGDQMQLQPPDRSGRRHAAPVAVVGSGPAGLSCAYFLAADGFDVTVFEANDEPGGMLRYAIPEYRLPSPVVHSIVDSLQRMGVVIQCGQSLHQSFTLEDLKGRGFRAVFLATGAGKAKQIDIEGVHTPGVHSGLDFLRGVRTGAITKVQPKVVVIGGGDVAMDAAMTAKRLGAAFVVIVALEDEAGLPAYRHNVESARAEGVDFHCSFGPEKVVVEQGRVRAVDLTRCVSVCDKKGRFSPRFNRAECGSVEADEVILAIGQVIDPSGLPKEILAPDGSVRVSPGIGQTSIPYVFAGGDLVTGPASVAQAVGSGKRAARAIALRARGIELEQMGQKLPVFSGLPEGAQLPRSARYERKRAKPDEEKTFGELYQGFDLVEALAEASRCLTCGAKSVPAYLDDCMTCFNCEINCPAGAIFVHPFKEIFPRSLRPMEPR